MRSTILQLVLAAVVASTPAGVSLAAEPCTGFKWDVSHELALFAGSATTVTTGKDSLSAPTLDTDRLYELDLTPQTQNTFAVPPGKKMLTDGAYAGVLQFKVSAPGSYRVSVDVPLWIDIVGGGQLVATKDFQGQQKCAGPHKIVVYELAAVQPYFLQVSASAKAVVRLSITPSPKPIP